MEKADFWKSLKAADIKMPAEVLEEYATSFNNRFGHYIVLETRGAKEKADDWAADISTLLGEESEPRYEVVMRLLVPSIKDYTLPVLKIKYQISNPYPCTLFNMLNKEKEPVECQIPDNLDNEILKLLTEGNFLQKVSIILAQVGFKEA